MTTPGLVGEWSARELIAHLGYWAGHARRGHPRRRAGAGSRRTTRAAAGRRGQRDGGAHRPPTDLATVRTREAASSRPSWSASARSTRAAARSSCRTAPRSRRASARTAPITTASTPTSCAAAWRSRRVADRDLCRRPRRRSRGLPRRARGRRPGARSRSGRDGGLERPRPRLHVAVWCEHGSEAVDLAAAGRRTFAYSTSDTDAMNARILAERRSVSPADALAREDAAFDGLPARIAGLDPALLGAPARQRRHGRGGHRLRRAGPLREHTAHLRAWFGTDDGRTDEEPEPRR